MDWWDNVSCGALFNDVILTLRNLILNGGNIMKKIICLLLSTLLIFCASSVFADNNTTLEKNILLNSSTAISKYSRDLTPNTRSILEAKVGEISDNTLIEVLSVNEIGDTAICLSTQDGNNITKNICLSFAEDAEGNMVVDNSLADTLAANSDSSITVPYNKSTYTVYATATTATYIDNNTGYTYYKPYHCEFYYVKHTDVTVSSIQARYTATGALYTYPGYTSLNETYTHIVPVYASFPTAGVTYSNDKYFATDRVLDTTLGFNCGHYIDFYNRVNGETHEYNIRLF